LVEWSLQKNAATTLTRHLRDQRLAQR